MNLSCSEPWSIIYSRNYVIFRVIFFLKAMVLKAIQRRCWFLKQQLSSNVLPKSGRFLDISGFRKNPAGVLLSCSNGLRRDSGYATIDLDHWCQQSYYCIAALFSNVLFLKTADSFIYTEEKLFTCFSKNE